MIGKPNKQLETTISKVYISKEHVTCRDFYPQLFN